jgi:hypothetical protein
MIAHQRKIREDMAAAAPRAAASSLADYAVQPITRADAVPLILRYEWLGTVGAATLFIGLLSPQGELEGAACFGWGAASGRPVRDDGKYGDIRDLLGAPAMCLMRGACVHYAPRNAASFLITRACKLAARITGATRFFAYADPMAGEYGGVYQAANWIYLGQGLDGEKRCRERRRFVLQPGRDPDVDANWQTTRVLRHHNPPLTFGSAKAAGWRIAWREAKHVYAINVGRDRVRWRKGLAQRIKPYPSPRPELKLVIRKLMANA